MKTDLEILHDATGKFCTEFPAKFKRGMEQYTTPITDKDCLAEAEQEVFDLWAYLQAERTRRDEVKSLIQKAQYSLCKPLEPGCIPTFGLLEQALALLETKPLAQKKKLQPELELDDRIPGYPIKGMQSNV